MLGPPLLRFLMRYVLMLLSEEMLSRLLCSCFEFSQDPEPVTSLVGTLSSSFLF